MSKEVNLDNMSYLRCEINGTQFLLQAIPNYDNSVANSMPQEKAANGYSDVSPYENDEYSVPLVYLDRQIYTFQDGELKEFDFNKYVDQSSNAESVTTEKEDEHENADLVRSPEYLREDDILVEQIDDADNGDRQNSSTNHVAVLDDKKFVIGLDSLNASDFAEVVTAFKCKICPYTTQDKIQLLEHFENVHINPGGQEKERNEFKNYDDIKLVYMCGECSSCFETIDECRNHMIQDHQLMDDGSDTAVNNGSLSYPQQPYLVNGYSDECGENNDGKHNIKVSKMLGSRKIIGKNMQRLEMKEKNVKCMHQGCLYKFSNKELMHQHANCHMDSQHAHAFKCNICKDVKFSKWKPCSLHLWKEHKIDIDLLSCKMCETYKSATMVKLVTHMRVHSENREYECPVCGKCFKQSSQLRNHRVMHLNRKSNEAPRWYTSKTCELCGKTYADSKCLKNHMQAVHSKLRPYVCNVCGHSSARKAMLQMHLRQHTGDKPYSCDICDYKTGDHNSLRRHIMRHTGVRPYKCPHCSYSAIQSNSYKNHLRSKHPLLAGVYTCDLCPFKTVNKESYVQHVGNHEKGLIKAATQKKGDENVEVFPGNIAAAQLIYSCLGAFSKDGKTIEANLMTSSTSADGTSQTITIQIPSKDLEGTLPTSEHVSKSGSLTMDQEDDETMHCFLAIPREEEENIDTGGITIPAEPEAAIDTAMDVVI
ncbi:zinc finger protein 569 isoform X1 [Neodiprion lecontei]|uniref:Zinc finger protein 569 isoform X1 n=1 Tax=Neodiprion lecontei TaxID=441921 RepID=A0ABM3GP35_NEOLC|nr:zinc finger protein 569 isoform X1 [Neodiprion lecontei]XP_046602033.1 zinc finger protein 569 isoform X1 [Neodiprion lecontei]